MQVSARRTCYTFDQKWACSTIHFNTPNLIFRVYQMSNTCGRSLFSLQFNTSRNVRQLLFMQVEFTLRHSWPPRRPQCQRSCEALLSTRHEKIGATRSCHISSRHYTQMAPKISKSQRRGRNGKASTLTTLTHMRLNIIVYCLFPKVSIFIGSAETILGRCAETHYGNEWGVGGTHKSGQEYEYQPPGPRLSEHPSAHLDNICNLV